jgi:hypothetical protein
MLASIQCTISKAATLERVIDALFMISNEVERLQPGGNMRLAVIRQALCYS